MSSTSRPNHHRFWNIRSRVALSLLGVGLAGTGSAVLLSPSDSTDTSTNFFPTSEAAYLSSSSQTSSSSQAPLPTLLRTYLVYTLCSFPSLVDASPGLLASLLSSPFPGVARITEWIVRRSFFTQFVGGDTAEDALPILNEMRERGVGALFAYSVEVEENEASGSGSKDSKYVEGRKREGEAPPHKRIVAEMLHAIDVAAEFEESLPRSSREHALGRRTWVAIKLTALLPHASSLVSFSRYLVNARPSEDETGVCFPGEASAADLDILDASHRPTIRWGHSEKPEMGAEREYLTEEDIRDLRELRNDLFAICQRAKSRGVRVIVDAEYSWYQLAIDAYTLALMREFNRLPGTSFSSTFTTNTWISRLWSIRDANYGNVVGYGWRDEKDKLAKGGEDVQPLVYGTFQCYLRRTPAHLRRALADAQYNGYILGVKLVRGAYHPHEIAAHVFAHPDSVDQKAESGMKGRSLPEQVGVSNAEVKLVEAQASVIQHGNESSSESELERRSAGTPAAADLTPSSPSISPDPLPPVWRSKRETDVCYNACARLLIEHVAGDMQRGAKTLGVLFGTHNWRSCGVVLDALERAGLATRVPSSDVSAKTSDKLQMNIGVIDRIAIGQLYGMSDALTGALAAKIETAVPFVIKYVPYGALADVMPYLSRRAIENKSMLSASGEGGEEGSGGAIAERRRAGGEIRKRLRSWFTFGGTVN